MLNHFVIIYIDNILIYSDSLEQHIIHVKAVLQHLIDMDEKKVNSVLNWPRPTTEKELQRFQRFANFNLWFIKHFSIIAAT